MSMSPVYLPCSNKCMPCGKGRVVHYTKGNKAHAVGHLVQRLKDGRWFSFTKVDILIPRDLCVLQQKNSWASCTSTHAGLSEEDFLLVYGAGDGNLPDGGLGGRGVQTAEKQPLPDSFSFLRVFSSWPKASVWWYVSNIVCLLPFHSLIILYQVTLFWVTFEWPQNNIEWMLLTFEWHWKNSKRMAPAVQMANRKFRTDDSSRLNS